MAADHHRSDRVAAAIREEVATFLAGGVKDPRVAGLVTVTGVEVSRDLRSATVFVSVLGTDEERATTVAALADVAVHLRGHVGRALRLRAAPALTFKYDESVQRAARIESLLAQVKRDASPGDEPAGD